MIYDWETSSQAVVSRIAAVRSPFKILLKIKNDTTFLKSWIEHHEKIVGRENIIVTDNGSDDADYLEQLNAISEECTVFTYSGFVNTIHWRASYRKLYDALRVSCEFFIASDADERLCWVDGDTYITDERVIGKIQDQMPFDVFPGLLINNKDRSLCDFQVPRKDNLGGLVYPGKPIVASHTDMASIRAPLIHNLEFPSKYFRKHEKAGIVNLHLVNYSPEQRINSNRQKLISMGVIPPDASYEDMAGIDPSTIGGKPRAKRFVLEIQQKLRQIENPSDKVDNERCMTMLTDGRIKYSDEQTRSDFHDVLYGASDMLSNRFQERQSAAAKATS